MHNGNHNYNGGASVVNLKYVDSGIDHHGCDNWAVISRCMERGGQREMDLRFETS